MTTARLFALGLGAAAAIGVMSTNLLGQGPGGRGGGRGQIVRAQPVLENLSHFGYEAKEY